MHSDKFTASYRFCSFVCVCACDCNCADLRSLISNTHSHYRASGVEKRGGGLETFARTPSGMQFCSLQSEVRRLRLGRGCFRPLGMKARPGAKMIFHPRRAAHTVLFNVPTCIGA